MGLKEQAAQMAQATAREEREKRDRAQQNLIKDTEDLISYGTGVEGATYLRDVEVAYLEQVRGSVTYGTRSGKVLATKTGMLFQVDDVELLVTDNGYDRLGSIALALTDAHFTPSYYTPEYKTFYLPTPDPVRNSLSGSEPDAEKRREKFLRDLANTLRTSGNLKHPLVRLAEAGETCPTCGRGW